MKLEISLEYTEREREEKDRDVRGWVEAYCFRNAIPNIVEFHPRIRENYLILSFRSERQCDTFVRRGNARFPYFEFQ